MHAHADMHTSTCCAASALANTNVLAHCVWVRAGVGHMYTSVVADALVWWCIAYISKHTLHRQCAVTYAMCEVGNTNAHASIHCTCKYTGRMQVHNVCKYTLRTQVYDHTCKYTFGQWCSDGGDDSGH
eukprot:15450088-Alexandrium_andersonii.AAC.1